MAGLGFVRFSWPQGTQRLRVSLVTQKHFRMTSEPVSSGGRFAAGFTGGTKCTLFKVGTCRGEAWCTGKGVDLFKHSTRATIMMISGKTAGPKVTRAGILDEVAALWEFQSAKYLPLADLVEVPVEVLWFVFLVERRASVFMLWKHTLVVPSRSSVGGRHTASE
ncbi:hypothetical protein BCR44DRAFT_358273 [Catenaria anguillulae PL171]|uniref:Uncharacterized protein n=1 Tax=Catenaria anguillulae PL171 TaxID=765915 RepID=A0A1Y2H7H5_9FUNG|nr:hypothetical protein BCR44DRAFT_358273 [Catenaria anguillulae PL171]